MREYTLVNHPETICERLADEPRVGVDTEFMRERTYNAELCLVQIATSDHIYCVDPLAGNPMTAFWDTLLSRSWVVHSARQDLEVVIQTAHRLPETVFDTQVAAGLVGYAPQIGYASLVHELFGTEIAKSHTRADWSKRPLADEVLHYAAEDVEYLLPACHKLVDELKSQGRLSWAEEDSALLLDESLYRIDPASAVGRLKGARNLRGLRRAVATRLAEWRENEAQRLNRPRQWIARDALLVGLANTRPATISALKQIEDMPPALTRRAGKQLLETIARAATDSSSYEPPAAPTEAQKRQIQAMQAAVASRAEELGIAAEILASRKDLTALCMDGNERSRVLHGWRREVIGSSLLELM